MNYNQTRGSPAEPAWPRWWTTKSRQPRSGARAADPFEGRKQLREACSIRLDRIIADPDQPRKEFDPEALDRLAESLRARGQLQPIRVRWDEGRGVYVVVVGERRWRAARLAGLESGLVRRRQRRTDGRGDPGGPARRERPAGGPEARRAGPGVPDADGRARADPAATRREAPDQPDDRLAVALAARTWRSPCRPGWRPATSPRARPIRSRRSPTRGPGRAGRPSRGRGPEPCRDRRGGAACVGSGREGQGPWGKPEGEKSPPACSARPRGRG